MKALRIPAIGPIDVIELAEPGEHDAAAFLADLHAAISCASVECLDLATICDMWLDETGLIDGRTLNRRATLLARSYGFHQSLHGDVVVVGTDDNSEEPAGLTDEQAEGVARRTGELLDHEGTTATGNAG